MQKNDLNMCEFSPRNTNLKTGSYNSVFMNFCTCSYNGLCYMHNMELPFDVHK